MILRQHGGIWLDADTIILNESAAKYFVPPEGNKVKFFGDTQSRSVHICYIQTKPESRCLRLWDEYVKNRVQNFNPPQKDFWAYFGNSFIDIYSKTFIDEIEIFDAQNVKPEFPSPYDPSKAYIDFYFLQTKHLHNIKTDMMILHNSWTPAIFRELDKDQLLHCNCTMANVLAEVLELDRSSINEFTSFHKRENKQTRRLFWFRKTSEPEDKFAI